MTDQTAQEPTMEEILASIRRIISEDDAPAETAPAPAAAAPASPAAEPDAEPESEAEPVEASARMDETPAAPEPEATEEDVLELTEAYEAPAAESIGDLDVTAAEDEPEPEPFPGAPVSESVFTEQPIEVHTPEHPSIPTTTYDSLVGDSAAASAASAFAGLASSLKKPEPMEPSTPSGPTLDELARSLLRPMLKEWLDANLPAIVEAQVRKEVERIARSAG
jgi:cell pole-organizing protein PopZ